jgi:hypothetical protein
MADDGNCHATAEVLADGGRGRETPMAVIECGRKAHDDSEVHVAQVANSKPTLTVTWVGSHRTPEGI